MGSRKKKARAATKANSKATAVDQHPCLSVLPILRDIASKDRCWTEDALLDELYDRVMAMITWVRERTQGGQPIENTAVSATLLQLSAALVELVAKLLPDRKQTRDWHHDDYSCMVFNRLLAARTVLRVQVKHSDSPQGYCELVQLPGAFGRINRSDILRQTAVAQEEVCQLLQAGLKQQQHHQHQHRHQQAAQGISQQQHHQLCGTALQLLSWWTTVNGWWSELGCDASASQLQEALSSRKPALELAALLAQTLTADSVDADYHAIAEVVSRCEVTPLRTGSTRPCIALAPACSIHGFHTWH
jgi:hypothetical protein